MQRNRRNFKVERFERHIASIRTHATAYQYGAAARRFLRWLATEGHQSLSEAPPSAVADYCAHLARIQKPLSVRLQVSGVNRYLEWCRAGGLTFSHFHPPEVPRHSPKMRDVLDRQRLVQYFEATEQLEEPTRTAARLLPCCGLRVSEIAALEMASLRSATIKLKNGRLKKVVTIRVLGKGGRERSVPVLDEGKAVLTEYLRGWRRAVPDDKWLFPTAGGHTGHLVGRSIRAALQRLREPLKMTFTPHTMRRTYLTELYHRGVEPVMLAKIAGHADVGTLVKHYLALDDQDVVKAVHEAGGQLLAK